MGDPSPRRVLVDHQLVARLRIEHPPLDHDRPVDIAGPPAVDRREEDCAGVAVELAEDECPARQRLDLGLAPQARPVGVYIADLAGEHDSVARVRASPQPVERGVCPPRTGERREREPRGHAREEPERDQRPPTMAHVGAGQHRCRRGRTPSSAHHRNVTSNPTSLKGRQPHNVGGGATCHESGPRGFRAAAASADAASPTRATASVPHRRWRQPRARSILVTPELARTALRPTPRVRRHEGAG